MKEKVPHLLFKKTWVDFLRDEFNGDAELTMKVFFAIADYAYEGVVPDDITLRMAIGTIRKEIDNDRAAYEELSGKRRQARMVAVESKQNQQTQQKQQMLTNETNATNVDNILYNNINYNNNSSSNDNELNNNNKKTKAKKGLNEILSPEEIQFNQWLKDNYPRIARMEKPLLLSEYNDLLEKHGEKLLLEKMAALNNKKKIDYVYAKQTLNNWCNMEVERNGTDRKVAKPKSDLLTEIFGHMSNN